MFCILSSVNYEEIVWCMAVGIYTLGSSLTLFFTGFCDGDVLVSDLLSRSLALLTRLNSLEGASSGRGGRLNCFLRAMAGGGGYLCDLGVELPMVLFSADWGRGRVCWFMLATVRWDVPITG